jgi:hypothetical protein
MIIQRIKASLSLDATLTVNEPTLYDRIFVPNHPDNRIFIPNINNLPKSEFIQMPMNICSNEIISNNSPIHLNTNLSLNGPSPLSIVKGPYIENITFNDIVVSIDIKGRGYIYCNLYELPVYADYYDALTILSTESERNKMMIQQTLKKYCDFRNENKIFFKFINLKSYCNYCVVLSLNLLATIPSDCSTVLQFNTLSYTYNDQQSMVIVPLQIQKNMRNNIYGQNNVSDMGCYNAYFYGDKVGSPYPLPCMGHNHQNYKKEKNKMILDNKQIQNDIKYKLSQISSLIDSYTRVKALPISMSPLPTEIYNQLQYQNDANINTAFLRLNMYNMNKNNNFLILKSMSIKNVNIEIEGKFCRLMSYDTIDAVSYMHNLIVIINQLKNSNYNHIKIITIVLDYPLIKHLQVKNDKKNINNQCKIQQLSNTTQNKFENEISKNLVNLLLLWKSYCKYRDCIIVSTLPVEYTKCVTITLKILNKFYYGKKANSTQSFTLDPLTSHFINKDKRCDNKYDKIKFHKKNKNSISASHILQNEKDKKYHRITIRQVILPFKINKSINSKKDHKDIHNSLKNMEYIFPIGLQHAGKSYSGRGNIEFIVRNVSNQPLYDPSICSPHPSLSQENNDEIGIDI